MPTQVPWAHSDTPGWVHLDRRGSVPRRIMLATPSPLLGGDVLVRLRQLQDQIRSGLSWVPKLFVVGSLGLAEIMLRVDQNVGDLPAGVSATVDSARSVLAVVAGATLAFVGIAFSVGLLLISLASSRYSPRVVHGLFRDPFKKRVMGVVIGTFVYCLLVLNSVQTPPAEEVATAALLMQADLVLEAGELAEPPAYDLQRVRTASNSRFGS